MQKVVFAIALCAIGLPGCDPPQLAQSHHRRDLKVLVANMTGDFSSEAQSKRDSDYFDIRLHIHTIWNSDAANHWLYVEQAMASAEAKPYRQRVYKVEMGENGTFKSIVYTLPNPAEWVGKYKTPADFDKLKPADLSLREGCTVYLKRQRDGTFAGKTEGQGCESTIRGAKYASATVTVSEKMLKSWDQGFNEKGEQVWGATKGGYEFIKQ